LEHLLENEESPNFAHDGESFILNMTDFEITDEEQQELDTFREVLLLQIEMILEMRVQQAS